MQESEDTQKIRTERKRPGRLSSARAWPLGGQPMVPFSSNVGSEKSCMLGGSLYAAERTDGGAGQGGGPGEEPFHSNSQEGNAVATGNPGQGRWTQVKITA